MKQSTPITITKPRGNAKAGPLFAAAIGQKVRRADQQQQQDNPCRNGQASLPRRNAQAEQATDTDCCHHCAQTVEAVKARHHRLATGPLYQHSLNVHDAIERAYGGSKGEQHQAQPGCGRNLGEKGKGDAHDKCGNGHHASATQPRCKRSCQRHGKNRTSPQTQQQGPQGAVLNRQSLFGERHHRCPGCRAKASHEKSDACCTCFN